MMRFLFHLLVLFALGTASLLAQEPERSADPRALEQFIKGNAAAEQGNPYQAIFHFEEAIRYDTESPYLYVALAEQYLVLAQDNNSSEAMLRAEQALAAALKLDPNHEAALRLQSRLFSAGGNAKDARKLLERLAHAHPANSDYRMELLALNLADGQFDAVDSLYRIEQARSEPDLDLTRRIVAVYLVMGASERALPYMNELFDADSTDAGVTYTLATLHLQSGDTATAVQFSDRAISLDSTDARYWYLKLVIEFDKERFGEVLALAARARNAAGEDAKSANLEGLCYIRQGDSTQAIERFLRALDLDSTLYPAAGSLGLLYEAVDSLDLSVLHYERAIRLSDSTAVYLNNLAYSYAVRGIELERAMSLVDAALDREPDNPSYLDTKGWIYYQLEDYKEAVKWIKKALKEEESAPLHEHLGDVFEAMGKASQARQSWERALRLDPASTTLPGKLAH